MSENFQIWVCVVLSITMGVSIATFVMVLKDHLVK
jgi:hypothetical protein